MKYANKMVKKKSYKRLNTFIRFKNELNIISQFLTHF